jgi:predicted nucleotidyltransferase
MTKLALLFGSRIRAELFRVLFGLHAKQMYQAEIKRLMKFAKLSIEQELAKLVKLELLNSWKEGTLRYYSANIAHPLYPELRNIVLKTVGLHDVVEQALVSNKIEFAFVFGSLAQLTERAESDVDLMVIGEVGRRELTKLLHGVTEQVGREVNSHIFNWEEISNRAAKRDHFLNDVLSKPKLFVKGNEDEFTKMVGIRMATSAQDKP